MTEAADIALLAAVDAFASAFVAPAAPGWSMGGAPAPHLFTEAARLGLMGLEVPEAHGGLGRSFALKAKVCERLAAVDAGFALSVVNTHNVALRLCLSAAPEVRDAHVPGLLSGEVSACTALTEAGAGADLASLSTMAVRETAGYRLTGEKVWIVNGRHAGLSIVFAQFGERGDRHGIGAILVDLTDPAVTRTPQESAFAQGSIGTGRFVMDGVLVPQNHVILTPGVAFNSILTEINGARAYVAAMACGMLGAALEEATAYGNERQTFGVPLVRHQGWRAALGAAATDLAAARALTSEAAAMVAEGADAQLIAAQAKVFAVEAAQRHLPQLFHSMGAVGLEPERCFTRHIAAAQIAGLTDGATSLLLDRIAKIVGTPPDQSRS